MGNDYAAARMIVERALAEQASLVALRDALLSAERADKGVTKAQAEQASLAKVLDELRDTKLQRERELESAQQALAVANDARIKLDVAFAEKTGRLNELSTHVTQREQRRDELGQTIATMKADADQLGMQVGTLRKQLDDARATHAAFLSQAAAERTAIESELARLRARFA
jgi:chromosome segregation ATPase